MIRHRFQNPVHLRFLESAPAGPPLLYIHGLGESALGFEGLMSDTRLSHFSHIAPDLPGYGKSPWQSRPQSLEEQAEFLAQWLPKVVSEPVIVLGHSMGGVIGLLLCERYPRLVKAFLNVEGNISLGDCGFSGRIVKYSASDFLARGFEEIATSVYKGGLTQPALRTYFASLRLCDPRLLYQNSEDLVSLSRGEELALRLGALPIPQLYLLGHPDGTGDRSRDLLDEAGVPWKAIENAGHWPFLDQHQSFIEELEAFLRKIES